MKPQSFAVDTNFLLDLVAPHDDARDALDVIRRRLPKAGIIATDSVLDEINHFASKPGSTVQAAVRKAMFHMSGHGIRPVCLSDLQAALADSIAGKILTHGIVPRTECNDASILAEAAVLGCQILLSSDSHLRNADRGSLALLLQSCDVPVVVVCAPGEITRLFAGRR